MAWVRAVWREKNAEEEGTVPDTWIDLGKKIVHWPMVSNAQRYLDERQAPKPGWRRFGLIKVKFQSG